MLAYLIGAIAGYYGGFIDNILMRFTEAMLNIPEIFLLIVMAKFFGGKIPELSFMGREYSGSLIVIIVIIGLTSWMYLARIVRAEFLSIKSQRIRAGSQSYRHIQHPDHFQAYITKLYRPHCGDGYTRRRKCHPGRGVYQFPGPGCATSNCYVGQYAGWGQSVH